MQKKIIVYPYIGDAYYITLNIPTSIETNSDFETAYVDEWLSEHTKNVDCWDNAK